MNASHLLGRIVCRGTAAAATLFLVAAPVLAGARPASPPREPMTINADGSLIVGNQFYGSMMEYQESSEFKEEGRRCGTPRTLRDPGTKAAADCSMVSTTIRTQYAPANGGVYQIPVVFHIILKTDGTGAVSDALVQSQIAVLNEDYRAIAGSLGGPGNDAKIQFVLATTNPSGGATTGIERVTNNSYFVDPGPGVANPMKQALKWDPTRYFNIYTNDAAGNLGYATFPAEDAGTYQDGVVLLYSSVGRDAPQGGIYNKGRTATHEVGHYLGLFHTFQSGCGTGYTAGDLIADTEAQSTSTFNCPVGATSCSGARNPIENYMNYTQDTCMNKFTIEQANRMRCSLTSYRGTIYTVVGGGTNTPPTANFTFTTSNLTATFTDTSSDTDGTLAGWSWNFGDATTSTVQSPSKTYASAGTRTVALTVTDNGGATGATSKSVTVSTGSTVLTNGVAVTGISGALQSSQVWTLVVPSGASGLKFVTTGGTGDADLYAKLGSAPTTTVNDCKSEGTSAAETCTPTASTAGTWYVMIYGYAAYSGVSLTGSYTTTVNTPPTANFTFTTSGLTATFTDTSTDTGGSVTGWSWNFGDSTTSTTRNPVKTYTTAGTRTVSLTATDNGGLTGSVSKSVTVATSTCTAVTEVEANNTTAAAQALTGTCSQISGTFLNDSPTTIKDDYFKITLPAGKKLTALLNGLTVDYDLYLYKSGSTTAVASGLNGGTTAETISYTNTGSTSVVMYVRAYRYSSTRTTYQLKVSYP